MSCGTCAEFSPPGKNAIQVAQDVDKWVGLYQCRNCGSYWEVGAVEWHARELSAAEAQVRFPKAFETQAILPDDNSIRMKTFQLYEVWCNQCRSNWTLPSSSVEGDWHVFHTPDLKEHFALNVYEDPFFDELEGIVKMLMNEGRIKNFDDMDIDHLVSEVSDPCANGVRPKILSELGCPVCGHRRISFQPVDPVACFHGSVEPLRHAFWSSCDEICRRDIVEKVLAKGRVSADPFGLE